MERIQCLSDVGLYVCYDGDREDEWNDWDDNEDGDSDDDVEIDVEEVKEKFPSNHGFTVSNDGKSITLDLNKQSSKEDVKLSKEQIDMIMKNKQTITIEKEDVKTSVPSTTFDNSEEAITISVNELRSEE